MEASGSLPISILLLLLALLSSGYVLEEVGPELEEEGYDIYQEVQKKSDSTTCEYDGNIYPAGKFRLSPCVVCTCWEGTGKLTCSTEVCTTQPNCTKYESLEGQCCDECVEYGCFYNGTGYPLGSRIPTDACEMCFCSWEGDDLGRPVCMELQCPPVDCVDSKVPPGSCCPVCPNGPNCWYEDIVIPAGRDVWVDKCKTCFCPQPDETTQAGDRQALCYYPEDCT